MQDGQRITTQDKRNATQAKKNSEKCSQESSVIEPPHVASMTKSFIKPQPKPSNVKSKDKKQVTRKDEGATDYANKLVAIREQCGYVSSHIKICEGKELYVIDESPPRMMKCLAMKFEIMTQPNGVKERGWHIRVDSKYRKTASDYYLIWYPEWMLFGAKRHCKAVFKEFNK